jgi:hypothetical protein
MNICEIETPAVLIDADTLDRNLRSMASYCKTHNLALRPHTKTHKIPEIASTGRLQPLRLFSTPHIPLWLRARTCETTGGRVLSVPSQAASHF